MEANAAETKATTEGETIMNKSAPPFFASSGGAHRRHDGGGTRWVLDPSREQVRTTTGAQDDEHIGPPAAVSPVTAPAFPPPRSADDRRRHHGGNHERWHDSAHHARYHYGGGDGRHHHGRHGGHGHYYYGQYGYYYYSPPHSQSHQGPDGIYPHKASAAADTPPSRPSLLGVLEAANDTSFDEEPQPQLRPSLSSSDRSQPPSPITISEPSEVCQSLSTAESRPFSVTSAPSAPPPSATSPASTASSSSTSAHDATSASSHGKEEEDDDNDDNAVAPSSAPNSPQFKPIQEEKWSQRLAELAAFRSAHGHTLVPHLFSPNPQLARWVKRQRRQYKLLQEGKASALNKERLRLLEELDFVWDSHTEGWNARLQELRQYKSEHGDCLVPSTYRSNPQLAIWVKCQRRQHKLWREGRASSMTQERARDLEKLGFKFEVRGQYGLGSRREHTQQKTQQQRGCSTTASSSSLLAPASPALPALPLSCSSSSTCEAALSASSPGDSAPAQDEHEATANTRDARLILTPTPSTTAVTSLALPQEIRSTAEHTFVDDETDEGCWLPPIPPPRRRGQTPRADQQGIHSYDRHGCHDDSRLQHRQRHGSDARFVLAPRIPRRDEADFEHLFDTISRL